MAIKKFISHQGDISIWEVGGFTGSFEKKESWIVAEGETTGHKHILVKERPETKMEIAYEEKEGLVLLRVIEGEAGLRHEEHGIITFLPGKIYGFGRQKEYSPIEHWRKVMD